jgi:hypothetical protein
MPLELSEAEREVVTDVLTRAMGDLREEIYKTDTTDYKDQLREREAILAGVLQRLGGVSTS